MRRQIDRETCLILRQQGYDAAIQGHNHHRNPYSYMFAVYWYEGWEAGKDEMREDEEDDDSPLSDQQAFGPILKI